jgi:hypothetical protein
MTDRSDERVRRAIRDAMDRLIDGKSLRSDGKLTVKSWPEGFAQSVGGHSDASVGELQGHPDEVRRPRRLRTRRLLLARRRLHLRMAA